MADYIYRKENFGSLLYDINKNLIYYSYESFSSISDIDPLKFELQKVGGGRTITF